MTCIQERIGRSIKNIRLSKDIEIHDFAERLELSEPTIYNLEAGRQVALHTLHRACYVLDEDVVAVLQRAEGLAARAERVVYEPEYTAFQAMMSATVSEQRRFMGLTINQLAASAKIKPAHLKSIELNQIKLSFTTMQSICHSLDLYMSDFFDLVQCAYLAVEV